MPKSPLNVSGKQTSIRLAVKSMRLVFLIFALSVGGCNKESDKAAPTPSSATTSSPGASTAKTEVESSVAKLRQIGVKAQPTNVDELLISDGFPFAQSLKRGDVIEIAKVEGGLFTASTNSTVPTELPGGQGMVYGVAGGSFFAKCTVTDERRTLADAIGNTWVFAYAGMKFGVHATGTTNSVYTVETKNDGASIRFTDAGVVLKGFVINLVNVLQDSKTNESRAREAVSTPTTAAEATAKTPTLLGAERFRDTGNGIIYDTKTGLMWTKDANPAGRGLNWDETSDYIKAMNKGSVTNFSYTDWRLPTKDELNNLFDVGQKPGANPFTDILSGWCWSSTTTNHSDGSTWFILVGVGGGTFWSTDLKSQIGLVWPVRAGRM